ncbi:MAG: hypothetical protein ACQUYJ_18970, partial [Ferruginibacter sp.]
MKPLLISLFSFFVLQTGHAQIFKKLGDKIKRDAEWRIRSKADQQVSRGIDTVIALPKKIKDKKKEKANSAKEAAAEITNSNSATKTENKNPAGNIKTAAADENDMTPKDGFVTLTLSANSVFTGGIITVSGESAKVKNFTQVEISVSGPSGKNVKQIALAADGKYTTAWIAADKPGEYIITVKSSDKKAQQSAKIIVYPLLNMSNWCDDNIAELNKAYDKLKTSADKVKDGISSKDKAELDKKIAAVKEQVEEVLKLFKHLNTAGKETAQLAKSGKRIPRNLSGNLSALNNNLTEQSAQIKALEKIADHEPQDNSICEYIVMLNEACAAFQTFTNFWSRSISTIIINITTDKAVPQTVGDINTAAGGIEAPYDFPLKELTKVYASSKVDAEALTSKLGKAGIAADLAQFALDILLKTYCGVFKGSFTHDYTVEFRNGKGENWWTYGVETKAVVYLRYPKDKNKGGIIKMKGNIEGNGTKFSFFEDLEKNDEFQDGSKGKIEIVPIKAYTPFSVSVATSEKDVMGFGAIARGLATPAYFNIVIDAEYDVDAKKIKIFLTRPLIDFSLTVANQLVFLLVGGDLLPYVKRLTFPIHKVFSTLGSVVRDHNEFDVTKDAKGNPVFTGKANKHLGNKA